MKMIESVVYLYKKSQRLVFGRFQRTAGLGESPGSRSGSGSGSKESLGRFQGGFMEPVVRVNRPAVL